MPSGSVSVLAGSSMSIQGSPSLRLCVGAHVGSIWPEVMLQGVAETFTLYGVLRKPFAHVCKGTFASPLFCSVLHMLLSCVVFSHLERESLLFNRTVQNERTSEDAPNQLGPCSHDRRTTCEH